MLILSWMFLNSDRCRSNRNYVPRHYFFFFSSRRRHTRFDCDWSSDVCSSDLHSRGRGIGRLMLDVVITLTREWPELDHLWLHVMRHQTAARRLYLSCGFEVIRSEERRVGKECRSRWSPYH